MTQAPPKILYLVHDLTDAAVEKRANMLVQGGAELLAVCGFSRTKTAPPSIAQAPAINWGLTYNGGFIRRILSVLLRLALIKKRDKTYEGVQIIIARNLEMLALAVRIREISPAPKPIIIYESLDIHRLLLNKGRVGEELRKLERWLLKRTAGIITSSPAFIKNYFKAKQNIFLPIRLVENKVYAPDQDIGPLSEKGSGPPWKIGWFGILRCTKTLSILSALARNNPGKVEIVIRGRPAYDQIPDFDNIVKTTPGLSFGGPYKNPDDLAEIYRGIHFIWAIDMYEEGLNSSWLLPNRLYEGGFYGAVPLAREHVETGAFLKKLGIGIVLPDPLAQSLLTAIDNLSSETYEQYRAAVRDIPREQWLCDDRECKNLVEWLLQVKIVKG